MGNGLIQFEGKEIRTVQTDRGVEWIAADVCDVLGIDLPSNVLRRFNQTEKGVCTLDISGQRRELLTVTEPGLYRLIFKSRKPEAEKFREWITHEVLPCIRKHGCYPAPLVESGSRALVEVDQESMGRLWAKGAAVGLALGLREAFEQTMEDKIQPIRTDISNLKTEVRTDISNIDTFLKTEVCTRLDSLERRKELAEKTKRLHRYIINQYYSGKCPCCKQVLIVNSAGKKLDYCEYEHWVSKSLNGAKDTWVVCSNCNSRLRDRDFKQAARVHFDAYQGHRKDYHLATMSPFLPGIE